jgi:TolB protein
MMRQITVILVAASVLGTHAMGPNFSSNLSSDAVSGADFTSSETRLRNIRQLTNGGENAEAYFSPDGTRLIFQKTHAPEIPCDQIFTMKIDGSDVRRVSTGTGRTTCGYFYPDGHSIVFASTHLRAPECPPRPGYERGYVWPVYPGYDVFRANADGSKLQRLTSADGYDAEATAFLLARRQADRFSRPRQ